MTNTHDRPVVDLYTRNGFQGPASFIVRESYSPGYIRVEGTYRPQRLRTWDASDSASLTDSRALPITVLRSPTVRVDLWHLLTDTPFALRDVHRDQLIFVQAGHARLETDFGILDLKAQDFVLISRAVSFRMVNVDSLRTVIVGTPEPLQIAPDNPGMLDAIQHVDTPVAYGQTENRYSEGDYELILRHGDETSSYFYDYDPLRVLDTAGAPAVQRFNLRNVKPLVVEGANAAPPGRLIGGTTTETLIYYLGARKNGRPPIHHNADYDELCIYSSGPGSFGLMETPGTGVWVPKGIIHQGPEEDVPEGYLAWLLETRANLELTTAGTKVADLIETRLFGIHPSASETDRSFT